MKKLLKKKTLFAVLLAVVLFLALGSYLVISDTSYCEYIYEGDNPIYTDAKVAYSTGGMFASQVNMNAEGMGSRTKWYFCPNAFIREFVGLIVSQKNRIISVVLAVAVFAAATACLFS